MAASALVAKGVGLPFFSTVQLKPRLLPPPGSAAVKAVRVTGVPSKRAAGTPEMMAPSTGLLKERAEVSPVARRVAVAVTWAPKGRTRLRPASKVAKPRLSVVTLAEPRYW